MIPAQPVSSSCPRAWLGLLALTACTAPANEAPPFEWPSLGGAQEAGPGPNHPAGPPSEASAPSEAVRVPRAEDGTEEPRAQLLRLQIGLARAQRTRGELMERLESMSPADREGPTGRNLRVLLESLEEEIGSMDRELEGLTSQP